MATDAGKPDAPLSYEPSGKSRLGAKDFGSLLAIALAVSGVKTPHVTAESVMAIAVLGIVGTGFAYVLNYQIITSEGAIVASTVTYLLPVVAIVLGILVLDESITIAVLAGIALVLTGVALTRRRPKPATNEPQVE